MGCCLCRLQRLLDLSMETQGEMDALYDLAFSFIECGKTRQAKKVLDTPGLRSVRSAAGVSGWAGWDVCAG